MPDQFGNLSPEDFAQQQAITRQQRLASMLMQNTAQPQGQMVSGRYVAPSFFQNILPLVNAYVGKGMLEEGDTQQMKLAEAIRGRNAAEAQDIIQTLEGTPDYKPAVMPMYARDDEGNMMPPVEQQVGQAPNRQLALMKALKSTSPMGRMVANTLITKSLEDPKEFNLNEGDKRFRQNRDGTTTLIAEGRGKAIVVGNSIIVDGKEVYKGEEKPVQIDTGIAIQFRNPKTGEVLWSTPKGQMSAPRAPQVIDTPDGPMLVNTYTGQASPITMNGQPISSNKPLNEAQGNATAFGIRMNAADKIINDLSKKDVNFPSRLTSLENVPIIGGALGSGVNQLPSSVMGQSEEQQSLLQAKRNFITAVLRKESGAVISPSEFATEDLKYFPQRGDTDLVIKQKSDARKLAIQAMKIQAGSGAKQIDSVNTTKSTGKNYVYNPTTGQLEEK